MNFMHMYMRKKYCCPSQFLTSMVFSELSYAGMTNMAKLHVITYVSTLTSIVSETDEKTVWHRQFLLRHISQSSAWAISRIGL